jgi:endo-alpha-1,4-polygalactosaminidase (GH114 family)
MVDEEKVLDEEEAEEDESKDAVLDEEEDVVLEKIKKGKELNITENEGLLQAFLNKINKEGKFVREIEYGLGFSYGFMPTKVRIYKLKEKYYALIYEDSIALPRQYILTKIVKI